MHDRILPRWYYDRAPFFGRVARGPVIVEREKDHVLAARGLGAGAFRIVFRHILPNVSAPLIVQASVNLAFAILIEASLLGFNLLGDGLRELLDPQLRGRG